MKSNTITRLAVIGLGLVGKRHAASIAQVEDVELVACCDPSDEAKAYAHKKSLPWFGSISKMFTETNADGVILSTPTPMHVEQGLECIHQGIPVLIEKPLAVTAAAGEKLVLAASRANVPVLVGHHRRHNPLMQKARAIIDAGAIGTIRAVQAQCWFYKPDDYFDEAPWRKKTGAGPISVNLVHDVDLLRFLCGEVVSVQAQAAPSLRGFENEDVAAALLTFASGAIGTITVSDSIVAPWSWELTAGEYPVYPTTSQNCYLIGGSTGSLSIPDLKVWNHPGKQSWWEPIGATVMPREASDPLVNQIKHFAAVINHEETPLVSGEEGLKSLRVVEAIQSSAKSGETVMLA